MPSSISLFPIRITQSVSLFSAYAFTTSGAVRMEPIIGPTDILIFAFGADIGDWQNYSSDNQLFTYYKSQEFNIFCNVDSSRTNWVQFGDNYMRQARRNIDGYSMSHRADSLSDLFNVSEAWDSSRPQVPDL